MHKTPFAGLTAPDPNDPPLQVDGGSFATRNPDLTDHFLRIGAVTHVHDGHPSLPDPIVGASATVDTTGGTIPSGRDLYVGFTLLDNYGGETLLSPVVVASTPEPLAAPSTSLTIDFEPDVGNTVVGSFAYAITLVDEAGGETPIGPATRVERPPGTEFGQFNISGLAAELGPDLGSSWRLWRADNGGAFHIIAAGDTDTMTDDGIMPTDQAASPPTTGVATRSTNTLNITIPESPGEPGLVAGSATSGFALYISESGAFANPCLYATYPVASAGATITASALDLITGAPPDVSTSIPGAHKIAAAELADDVSLGGGGGGGGLPAEPADYTFPPTPFTSADNTDHGYYEEWEVVGGGRTDHLWRDNQPSGYPVGDLTITASGVAPVDPADTVTRAVWLDMVDGPPFTEGAITERVQFTANPSGQIEVYLGWGLLHGPKLAVDWSASFTSIGLAVGVYDPRTDNWNTFDDTSGNNGFINLGANPLAADTDYWLRLERDGINVTAGVYDEDPDINPSAVPLLEYLTTIPTSWLPTLAYAGRAEFGWSVYFSDPASVVVKHVHVAATKGGTPPPPGWPFVPGLYLGDFNDESLLPSGAPEGALAVVLSPTIGGWNGLYGYTGGTWDYIVSITPVIDQDGNPVSLRSRLEFKGGVTVTDDPAAKRTVISSLYLGAFANVGALPAGADEGSLAVVQGSPPTMHSYLSGAWVAV